MSEGFLRAFLLEDATQSRLDPLVASQAHASYLDPVASLALELLAPEQQAALLTPSWLTQVNSDEQRKEQAQQVISHLRLYQQVAHDPALKDDAWVLVVESGTLLSPDWLRLVRLIQANPSPELAALEFLALEHPGLTPSFSLLKAEQLATMTWLDQAQEQALILNDPALPVLQKYLPRLPLLQAAGMTLTQPQVLRGQPSSEQAPAAYLMRKSLMQRLSEPFVAIQQLLTAKTSQVQALSKTQVELGKEQVGLSLAQLLATIPLSAQGFTNPALAVRVTPNQAMKQSIALAQLYFEQSWKVNLGQLNLERELTAQLDELVARHANLAPEQQQLLAQGLSEQTLATNLFLSCQGNDYVSRLGKIVIAETGFQAWEKRNELTSFFAQEGVADFQVIPLPRLNDADFLRYLQLYPNQPTTDQITFSRELRDYRYNFAYAKLLAQFIGDAKYKDHDWVLVTTSKQVFAPDWCHKLNAFLYHANAYFPHAALINLASNEQFLTTLDSNSYFSNFKLRGKVINFNTKVYNASSLTPAAQALAITQYQLDTRVGLAQGKGINFNEPLLTIQSYKTPVITEGETITQLGASYANPLYLAANEGLLGGLTLPESVQAVLAIPSAERSPEQQAQLAAFTEESGIPLEELSLKTVQVGTASIVRPLVIKDNTADFTYRGMQTWLAAAKEKDLAAVAAIVSDKGQATSETASAELFAFRQAMAQPFNKQASATNQGTQVEKQLQTYAHQLTANASWWTRGVSLKTLAPSLVQAWPTAVSLANGAYVLSDWQARELSAFVAEQVELGVPSTFLIKVGALRQKAQQQSFDLASFESNNLVKQLPLYEGCYLYAYPPVTCANSTLVRDAKAAEQVLARADKDAQQLQAWLASAHVKDVQGRELVDLIPKFLVNLEIQPERRRFIEQQVGENFFTWTKAVDGRLFSPEESDAKFNAGLYTELYNKIIGKGEVGCTLSHCQIYERILQDESIAEQDWIWVIEDDLEFNSNWRKQANELLAFLNSPAAANLSLVLGSHTYFNRLNHKYTDEEVVATTFLFPDQSSIYRLEQQDVIPLRALAAAGSACYFIRKSALRHFEQEFKRPYWVADQFARVVNFTPSSVAIANPAFGIQDQSFDSTIAAERQVIELQMRSNRKQREIAWDEIYDFLGEHKYVIQRDLTFEQIKAKFPGYRIVPKLNWYDIPPEEFVKLYDREGFKARYGYEPSDDDINRALQHRLAYTTFVGEMKNVFRFGLFVEDNVELNPVMNGDLAKYANLYLKYVDTRLILSHRLALFTNKFIPKPFEPKDPSTLKNYHIYATHDIEHKVQGDFKSYEVDRFGATGAGCYMTINMSLAADGVLARPISWLYDDFASFLNFMENNFSYLYPCLAAEVDQHK